MNVSRQSEPEFSPTEFVLGLQPLAHQRHLDRDAGGLSSRHASGWRSGRRRGEYVAQGALVDTLWSFENVFDAVMGRKYAMAV